MSFELASKCGKLMTGSAADKELARRITIHALNRWKIIPEETRPIWTDIIEAVGFYPYIEKNKDVMALDSFADKVRQKSFLSDFLPDTYMHSGQKTLSDYLLSGKNVVASAPTSFGKSLLIEEIVASRKYNNIVIIQPTLALLDETRLKLKKYSDTYKIIVRTSQPASSEKSNLFLLTAERVMEYENLPHIDLLIIDEFYKMSLRRIDERADTLNNAFLKIYDTFQSKFYLLGPNIDGITPGFEKKYNAIFYRSDYSLVDCNIINMSEFSDQFLSSQAFEKKNLPRLFDLLDMLGGQQTLVYCSAPMRARRFARMYTDHLQKKGVVPSVQLPLIEWINNSISNQWSLSTELSFGVAVHDGSLPKHIGASVIQYFNEGKVNCIFCTSTIIEGVNTSAKNVIIFDGKKGNKNIDFFDYSNIKGRSGRLMEHYIGNVYNFTPVPQKAEIVIDIPFYEQDKDILSDEILVNIKKGDVKEQVLQRYQKLHEIDPELLQIIKLNGVNVDGQIAIFNILEKNIDAEYQNIAWSQIPDQNKLRYVLGLAENNISGFNFHDKHGVFSVKQLAFYLDLYRKEHSLSILIQNFYNKQIENRKTEVSQEQKAQYYDKAIEDAFHIYRHWFQFTVPKALRVIDILQRFVCERHGRKAGSYTYFVQQLENDFMRENLSILIEYGIPSDTVRKLAKYIPDSLDEDGVIQHIKANKALLYRQLIQYEKDRLEQCL